VTQSIETEATILSVEDDAKWKYSIEADIPAFDGDRSYKYLAWNKKQGPPPQVGAVGLGTFEPYQRSKYYVGRGDIEAGPVDGTETQYMVSWNMVAFGTAPNGAEATQSTSRPPNVAVQATSSAPAAKGATYLPAPTADERLAKEIAKFRREIEGVNDRKAVSDVLALAAPGTYTLDGLIEDAERLAGWYNTRLAFRLSKLVQGESPLVEAAQAAGAVVTSVQDAITDADTINLFDEEPGVEPPAPSAELPTLKNSAELAEWVSLQGWSKEQCKGVIQDAGFASSAQYLAAEGNTVPGLASMLREHLG